ncbi:efflux RND transporter periplasmic adaptor subunit [Kordiimonas sp.]|uniref:efflux RND transporter periplasmic adaptor subunit n=1 Tax=Kordiimonas sp. TaxID=1970157 RepID=UPI003A937A89
MGAPRAKNIVFGGMVVLVAVFLVYAFLPEPIAVDSAAVERGDMRITISDDGKTRVHELYVVSAPVAGRLLRLDPEVGDRVEAKKSLLAVMLPTDPGFLDERRAQEAVAAVRAAEAALGHANSEVVRAEAEVEYAQAEIDRTRSLVKTNTASPAALDRAKLAFKTATAQLETARSSVRMRAADVEVARAALIKPDAESGAAGGVIRIMAPIDGVVLTLNHESEGVVAAGAPLLELGDPADIEIVADFLSHQAVKVEAGARVYIEGWGGETLPGTVRRVEPKGFTKVSALGVEEQRVNIIIDFDGVDAETLARIGHGFRVEPRIVLWQQSGVLKVPTSALFRHGPDWAVFQIVDAKALHTTVQLGRMNDESAEVLSGLSEGDQVVLHPAESLREGVRVKKRQN